MVLTTTAEGRVRVMLSVLGMSMFPNEEFILEVKVWGAFIN